MIISLNSHDVYSWLCTHIERRNHFWVLIKRFIWWQAFSHKKVTFIAGHDGLFIASLLFENHVTELKNCRYYTEEGWAQKETTWNHVNCNLKNNGKTPWGSRDRAQSIMDETSKDNRIIAKPISCHLGEWELTIVPVTTLHLHSQPCNLQEVLTLNSQAHNTV